MLKIMEYDYVHHWNMVQDHEQDGGTRLSCYHRGACHNILRYYAMLLDCTLDEARDRMKKRIRGE